jgi:hypothetical protein
MKMLIFLSAIFVLTISAQNCNSNKQKVITESAKSDTTRYKARLETKAICMNYTLRLLEGNIDTSLIVSNWTDETTGKSYKNVFALGNPCTFPSTRDRIFILWLIRAASKNNVPFVWPTTLLHPKSFL